MEKRSERLEYEMQNAGRSFEHQADPAEVQGAEPLDGGFGGCPPDLPHSEWGRGERTDNGKGKRSER